MSWLMEGDDDLTSRADAARCLGQLGPAARPAVPALLRVLESGPGDRDTGHGSSGAGMISERSAVIEALGRIGDGRALGPLARVLAASSRPMPGSPWRRCRRWVRRPAARPG